jgi:DnaJ-class molecular chaperone
MSSNKCYYEVLGVSKDASDSDIKKAYRSLSLKYHPDRNQSADATTKFQEINQAYEIIGDSAKRREYDMMRNNPFGARGNMFTHMDSMHEFGNSNLNDIFNMMFHGMGDMEGIHEININNGVPEIKIFRNSSFGGGHNIFQQLQRPPPIIKNVTISLEEAYNGCNKPVEIERWIVVDHNTKTKEVETIYVPIPKGIDNNEIIILRDVGNVVNESLKGDVKLSIQIDNKTIFERHGLDLVLKLSITLKDALCGFSADIKHLSGKLLCFANVNTKTIINPHTKKVIQSLGMIKDNITGNLIIEFDIVFPTTLNDEDIKILSNILQK